ncbi:hypothetical protein ACQKOE_00120 [Novosphingobium sp. NPDC080210]
MIVTPAQAGAQNRKRIRAAVRLVLSGLDPGLRRGDGDGVVY